MRAGSGGWRFRIGAAAAQHRVAPGDPPDRGHDGAPRERARGAQAATRDQLTGLSNRSELLHRLAALCERSARSDRGRRAVLRPQRVQADQRHLRPPGRGRRAGGLRRAAVVTGARQRPGLPGRRRRVRHPARATSRRGTLESVVQRIRASIVAPISHERQLVQVTIAWAGRWSTAAPRTSPGSWPPPTLRCTPTSEPPGSTGCPRSRGLGSESRSRLRRAIGLVSPGEGRPHRADPAGGVAAVAEVAEMPVGFDGRQQRVVVVRRVVHEVPRTAGRHHDRRDETAAVGAARPGGRDARVGRSDVRRVTATGGGLPAARSRCCPCSRSRRSR